MTNEALKASILLEALPYIASSSARPSSSSTAATP
jgi:hypothetical protein